MKKAHYLVGDVARFGNWFAERLCGQPIYFSVPGAPAYSDLICARDSYSWPLRTQTGLPNPHLGLPHVHPALPKLAAHSSLSANTVVLDLIQRELRAAYKAGPAKVPQLSGAVASVFHWGGVYTGRGNRGWLTENHLNLLAILQAVVHDHVGGTDISSIPDLRFNAGMTKVYSLLIDDFIIYDSRVAAALAWLVRKWWTVDFGQSGSTLPELLRFTCLPANGSKANHRNPDASLFCNLNLRPLAARAYEHYTWNVRANWLLAYALAGAGSGSHFCSLREVEAALFQMGDRVI